MKNESFNTNQPSIPNSQPIQNSQIPQNQQQPQPQPQPVSIILLYLNSPKSTICYATISTKTYFCYYFRIYVMW